MWTLTHDSQRLTQSPVAGPPFLRTRPRMQLETLAQAHTHGLVRNNATNCPQCMARRRTGEARQIRGAGRLARSPRWPVAFVVPPLGSRPPTFLPQSGTAAPLAANR